MADLPIYSATLTLTEAINAALLAGNQQPIISEDDITRNQEALKVYHMLMQTSRDYQDTGYTFNTLIRVMHTPDGAGEVTVSADTIRVANMSNTRPTFTLVGRRIFDRQRNTFALGTQPVYLDLVIHRQWDDLPYYAKRLFKAQVAFHYATSKKAEGTTLRNLTIEWNSAKADFDNRDEELRRNYA
ncbi:hypothetical protein [Aestuariivirga sp.]|uniref:hypothetical protein n=1 Tax=Aestuariivirga sp. TaxID=2650926 RepID=UPI0039E5E12B